MGKKLHGPWMGGRCKMMGRDRLLPLAWMLMETNPEKTTDMTGCDAIEDKKALA